MIRALRVSKEIRERHHLRHDWPIRDDLTLDVILLNGDAVICQLVNLVFDAALVALEVVHVALGRLAVVWHALLGHEALLAAEVEDLVGVATVATELARVTGDQFLGRELHGLVTAHADTVLDGAEGGEGMTGGAVGASVHVDGLLHALWVCLTPVVALRHIN